MGDVGAEQRRGWGRPEVQQQCSHYKTWNLDFCHFFCNIVVKLRLPSCKQRTQRKPQAKPRVTGTLSYTRDSNQGSGLRQLAVSGNALDHTALSGVRQLEVSGKSLDHTAIRTGLTHYEVCTNFINSSPLTLNHHSSLERPRKVWQLEIKVEPLHALHRISKKWEFNVKQIHRRLVFKYFNQKWVKLFETARISVMLTACHFPLHTGYLLTH